MTPVIITPPAVEPVSLAKIKAHLKITSSNQDEELQDLITAARWHIETTLGRAFMTQTLEGYLPGFPVGGVIDIPRPPLAAVTFVKYFDTDGVERTLSADTYHVEPAGFTGSIILKDAGGWPATAVDPRAVTIRWIAGFADAATFPPPLKHAMKLLVAHWYYNREATGETRQALPLAFKALTDPYATHGWI